MALAFTAAIPWYKAKHIISAVGSLLMRDQEAAVRCCRRSLSDAEKAGISTIQDFTWKDMLHLDACTKCGRCHEACPARTAGYPLSPRDFILDLRVYNDEAQGCPAPGVDLVGGVIAPETLWACRTCGACQEICPVGIEHPSLIVRMRRQLVEQGEDGPAAAQHDQRPSATPATASARTPVSGPSGPKHWNSASRISEKSRPIRSGSSATMRRSILATRRSARLLRACSKQRVHRLRSSPRGRKNSRQRRAPRW
jgi:heterodisulfide reductase subunit C